LLFAKLLIDLDSFPEEFACIFTQASFKIMLGLHIPFHNFIIFSANFLQVIIGLLLLTMFLLAWQLGK
jgi:hypothetical protein